MKYFVRLPVSRVVLWCYLLWYLFFAARYFEASSSLWLTAVGLSGLVGTTLLLSTWQPQARLVSWTTARLFLVPFCVSSFSALVKGRGFFFIFSPHDWENAFAFGLCILFCAFVGLAKLITQGRGGTPK